MRAVNLVPADAKTGGGRRTGGAPRGPAIALVGLLGVALAFVTIYVLSSNTIKERTAKIATVRIQLATAKAEAARLSNYSQFVQLAQSRAATVRQIASSRFDWHAALSDLSKVVPANTSLQSLLGTVAPGASVSGAGGSVGGSAASTSALRGALPGPAFELKGCTATQDDVARLMSRLRLINGVTRVTLADSLKQDGTSVASTPASGPGATGSTGCGANTPTFDLVVFFSPLPGASPSVPGATGPAGSTGPASTAPGGSSTTGATPTSTAPAGGQAAPPPNTAPTTQQQASTTATSSSQPVSSGAPAGGSK